MIGVEQWSDEEGFAEAAEKTGITGICGSAIIEVVAEMYLSGVISTDGVVDGAMAAKSHRILENGRTFSYLLHDGAQKITVTQNDVRAIQLAKAALYAGIKLLMEKLEVETVDTIRFAGAFGSFIDPKYAMVWASSPIANSWTSKPSATPPAPAPSWPSSTATTAAKSKTPSPASKRSKRRSNPTSSNSSSTPWRYQQGRSVPETGEP